MNIIEVNKGEKIPFVVDGNKITFDDALTLNVARMERDFDVCIDICIDKYGMVTTGLGVTYAAQVEIPARQYVEKVEENPDYNPDDSTSKETIVSMEPVPFSMDNVTLKLYAI